jgi:hypothetical protein
MVKTLILIAMLFMGQNGSSAPIIHDFGKTPRNLEVGHIFTLENNSRGVLFIEGIESG